jgi:hypothetical protein
VLVLNGWIAFGLLLVAGAIGAGLESLTGSRAFAYCVAGAALAAAGWLVNHGAERRQALFWVPIQYWGCAIAVGALLGM